MVLFIMDSIRAAKGMVMVFSYGLLVQSMMATGSMIKRKVKASSSFLMEMSMMVNGLLIELMDTVFIPTKMELDMKDNGLMIFRMEKENKCGKTDQNLKATLEMV